MAAIFIFSWLILLVFAVRLIARGCSAASELGGRQYIDEGTRYVTRVQHPEMAEVKPGEQLMLHDEPIYLDVKIIGRTTSGNYSFNFNKNLAFGYIKIDGDLNSIKGKLIEIEIEKNKYEAEILTKPLNQKDYKNC